MDELRRHAAPLVDRWQRLARGQRVTMVAVLIASAAAFFFLVNGQDENWQPIGNGREFTASELSAIQSAWRKAGLRSFRRDAQKLLVPAADIARYTAAIPESQRGDNESDNPRGQSLAKANFFTSHEQLEQLKDNDLRITVERQLKAIPAIADAEVNWARSKSRTAFPGRSKVTATISVLPRVGHDLTPELAQSLRTAVAGMIPDLVADDIVVLDQSTGLTVTVDSEASIAEQQHRRQQERIAGQLESRIAATLAHIPNVTVQAKIVERPLSTNLHIAAKPIFSSAVVWTTDDPNNLIEFSPIIATDVETPPLPTVSDSTSSLAWQVAVQIPEASFDAHVAQMSLAAEHRLVNSDDLRDAEYARLRLQVQNLLPPDATLAELSIVPSSLKATTTEPSISFSAWPHVACGFIAVLCLTVVTRRRQVTAIAPPSNPAIEHLPSTAEVIADPIPAAREDADRISAIPPAMPTQPLSDLARLQQLPPQTLAESLHQERPQAIAVLLTRFPTRLASSCLSHFPPSLQTDVIRRLKSLGEVSEELVAEIAQSVCQRLATPTETIIHEPVNRIAHLLSETSTQRAFA